jgi:murein DD-endopeptidase MepM/ murein hydrolase activator NlpD
MIAVRHRWGAITAALALVLTAGALAVPSVSADPVTDRKKNVDHEVAQLKEDLEGTAADLVAAAVALRRAESALVDARAVQATALAALERAKRRDAELATRLALAEAAAAKTERDLAGRRDQERTTRNTLGKLAREAYLTSGLSGLAIALQADSPDQFADRMTVAGTALRQQNSAIARLQVMQAETLARQAKLSAAQAQVAELKRLAALEVAARRGAEQQAAAAAARVGQLVNQQAAAVAVISAKKAAEQARVDALEKEQNRLSAILAARAAEAERKRRRSGGSTGVNNDPAPRGGGILSYPAIGPLTSPFGPRYHPILRYWRMHSGQDWGIGCGTPVRAAASGTVISAGRAGGYGNRVVIDHGYLPAAKADLATTYNHLTSIKVYGGHVSRGQLIGVSGTTGLSTGCHLHFEVLRNGRFVNPRNYL